MIEKIVYKLQDRINSMNIENIPEVISDQYAEDIYFSVIGIKGFGYNPIIKDLLKARKEKGYC